MHVINFSQGSKDWLAWREQGITASDIPIILGLSPYKTRWMLWAEKTNRINPPDLSRNPNVQRGHKLEDDIRKIAEAKYGELLLPVCGENKRSPFLRASFDGVDQHNKPYEFKAPSERIWNEIKDLGTSCDTYKMYEAQVFAQCLVSESTEGRLIFGLEKGEIMDFPVVLEKQHAQFILDEAKSFWNLVQNNTPPEIDPEKDYFIPETPLDKFHWEAASDVWRSQYQIIKSKETELKRLKEELKVHQGSLTKLMGLFKQADMGGVKVSRFETRGAIDYKQLLETMFLGSYTVDDEEKFRKPSRQGSRFTQSEDELVNRGADDIVSEIPNAYL